MSFEVVWRHCWVLLIAATCFNVLIAMVYRRLRSPLPPDSRELSSLLWQFLLWSNIPWIIMGGLVLTKRVEGLLQLLELHQGNPYAILWMTAVGAILARGALWVFAGGGDVLARNGLLSIQTPRDAKILAVCSLLTWVGTIVIDLWGPFR